MARESRGKASNGASGAHLSWARLACIAAAAAVTLCMRGMPWRSAKRRDGGKKGERKGGQKGRWHHDAKTTKQIGGGSE